LASGRDRPPEPRPERNERGAGDPKKGFTIPVSRTTGTPFTTVGIIAVALSDVTIAGNVVIGDHSGCAAGIVAGSGTSIVVMSNVTTGCEEGVEVNLASAGTSSVSDNIAQDNEVGFLLAGVPVVHGNIAAGNTSLGFDLAGGASVTANAVIGNGGPACRSAAPPRLGVHGNNFFGNGFAGLFGFFNCGIYKHSTALNATGNFWGQRSGPGPDPGDDACNQGVGSITTIPFATREIKVPIKAP